MAHEPEAGKRCFLWQTAGYQVRARPSAMIAAGAKHMARCLDSRCGKSSCWAATIKCIRQQSACRSASSQCISPFHHQHTHQFCRIGTSPAEHHKKQQSFWGAWGPDSWLPKEAHSQICCCSAMNLGGHVQPFTMFMKMLSNYNSGYILFRTGGLPAPYTVGTA